MDIKETLKLHAMWTRNETGGVRADLNRAYLIVANLRGANLRGANLSVANLRGADLSGADLNRANLRGANLRGADLNRADLGGANLRGADLSGADLSGANLSGANLSGANLSESRGLLYASCSWSDHGERGRKLLGIIIGGEFVLFCGCFRGSPDALADYITNDTKHDAIVERTRRIAMAFVVERLTEMRDSRK